MLLAADVADAAGAALWRLARRMSREGRMVHHLAALERSGLIHRGGAGPFDERLVRLTEAGRRVLWGNLDPEAQWRRPWDGVWRMTMFDVPQSRNAVRVRLRRKLRDLRFGWLQNSVWLSPDPVSQLMQALREEKAAVESLLFMQGRPAGGESDAELVAGAWDFEQLGRLHATYLKFLKTRPGAGRRFRAGEWATWLGAEDRAWREIVWHDPFLPASLLPRDYAGRTVWEARREALQTGAQALVAASSPD